MLGVSLNPVPHVGPANLERAARAAAAVTDAAVNSGAFPCAVCAVFGREGAPTVHAAAGGEPAQPDSLFMIASITKLFTSTLIWQLVAQGRLLPSEPVSRFVPSLSGAGREAVTVGQLLSHTSGLREDMALQTQAGQRQAPPERHLELAASAELDFEPGSAFRYTSLTFTLLAEVIAVITAQAYPVALRERILEPLMLSDTGFGAVDAARAAKVHGFWGGPDALRYFESLSAPAGGLWSSARDLTRFGQALLGGQVLPPAAVAAATRQVPGLRYEQGGPAHYALGFGKGGPDLLSGPDAFGHGGATGTILWLDPGRGLGVAFLANVWNGPLDWSRKAVNAAFGA